MNEISLQCWYSHVIYLRCNMLFKDYIFPKQQLNSMTKVNMTLRNRLRDREILITLSEIWMSTQ